MAYWDTLAKAKVTDPAIQAFKALAGPQKNVWSLHTCVWEALRNYVEKDHQTNNLSGLAYTRGFLAVNEYKDAEFSETSQNWANRANMLTDSQATQAAGGVKNRIAALLEKYDAFADRFVGKNAQVTFKTPNGINFTGTVKITTTIYPSVLGLQQFGTLSGILLASPISFVNPLGMGNRGLKDKSTFIEISTGEIHRLRGTPTGTLGQNGYAIEFNDIERGH